VIYTQACQLEASQGSEQPLATSYFHDQLSEVAKQQKNRVKCNHFQSPGRALVATFHHWQLAITKSMSCLLRHNTLCSKVKVQRPTTQKNDGVAKAAPATHTDYTLTHSLKL